MLRSFRSVRLGHSQVRASSRARAEAAAVLCSVHRQQCSVIGQKLHKNRNQQRTCARNGQVAPGTVVDAAAAPGSPATPPRVQGIRKIGLDLTYSNSMLKWAIILKKYVVVLKLS